MNHIMSQVAEQLRGAREALQLTIHQVADATKIRTDHVRALEEGNFAVFSAPIYIRGSVKNYARLLKLDVPHIMAELDSELNQTKKYSEPPPLVEQSNSVLDRLIFLLAKVNLKIAVGAGVIVVGVLVITIIGMVLRHSHHANPQVNLPPAVYQSSNSGDTLPLPSQK
jgi:cytoskeletal protein RodZ